MDKQDAMQEIMDAVELSNRIQELRVLVNDRFGSRMLEACQLSESDYMTAKMEAFRETNDLYILNLILKSFDKNYNLNSMRKDADEHLDTIMRFINL